MISVIVPLHNLGSKGDYCLKRCLDSLLAQTYTDFEVLLMENGSTDDTVDIAQEYCDKDNRFKLHILDTVGIANARNEGIKLSNREYISFLDGDDTLSENFFEEGMKYFISKDISFVVSSIMFYYLHNNKCKYITAFENNSIHNCTKEIDTTVASTAWGKIIRRSILIQNNILFDDSLYGCDDILFATHLYLSSTQYAVCKDIIYYYTQNRLNQTTSSKLLFIAKGKLNLIDKLEKLYMDYNIFLENQYIITNYFIHLFIGSDFALTPLRKLDKNNTVQLINQNKYKILEFNTDSLSIPHWQKIWFNRFQNSIKYFGSFGGYLFIKFMRLYRNLFIQPFKIKCYK